MRGRFPLPLFVLLGLMLVLSACGSEDTATIPEPSFIGAWKADGLANEDGIRVYERMEERTLEAEFELQASGLMWIRRGAYVGEDWPIWFHCEGSWYEEQDGVVVLSYLFRDFPTIDRLTVLSVDALEMRCRWSRTK